MRSSSGGCVAQRPPKLDLKAWAKKKVAELGRAFAGHDPAAEGVAADFLEGAADRRSGLRVNWTAEASARNSRWRDTAAWIKSAEEIADVADDQQGEADGEDDGDFASAFLFAAAGARCGRRPSPIAKYRGPSRPMTRIPKTMAVMLYVEAHVAVEDVAEFVGDDALQLVAVEAFRACRG